jgi:hypothetical protein
MINDHELLKIENHVEQEPVEQEEAHPAAGTPPNRRQGEPRIERLTRLAQHLMWVGVEPSEVRRLLASYEPDRIERQLGWLPYRRAKIPSRLIVRAIEQDYEEPGALRYRIGHGE